MTLENSSSSISKVSSAKVPTIWGEFTCYVFRNNEDGIEHLAFVAGDGKATKDVLVRIHSECITGDIFQSQKCDCGHQLGQAMEAISHEGGIFIYLRGHEGRGIGIGAKIKAYALQEQGLDTVQANEELGLPVDGRSYESAAHILNDFGITSVRLITNNLEKISEVQNFGISVSERVSQLSKVTPENSSYLSTKNSKLGHLIEGLEN